MKKMFRYALSTAAALLLLGTGQANAEALKLRLSVESTPGSATQHMLASFRDALKAEMGDAVEIEFFDSGTLGDEIVHMQQVRTGQLDVIPIGSDAVQLDTKWAVFDIPFLFADREAVAKVLDGEIGAQLDASFQESRGSQGARIRRDRLPQHLQQRSPDRQAGRPRRRQAARARAARPASSHSRCSARRRST